MKARALCALTGVLALAITAAGATPAHAEDAVDVPDAGLRAGIAARLADTALPADFTEDNLARISDLPCYGTGPTISDLTGIEHLAGLQRLVVYASQVTDVSPVAGLARLSNLQVQSSLRYDPSPMLGLPSLTKLMITVQNDADGALLGQFAHVEQLYVHTAQPRMPELTISPSVRELTLGGTRLTGFSPVSGGTAVTRLSTSGGSLVSLDGLDGLAAVQTLSAGWSGVSDISAVAGMTGLTTAYLSTARISDLAPLRGLASLRVLYLGSNRIESLDGLSGLTGLEELDLSTNLLTSTAGLSDLPGLKVMKLANNQIAHVSGLPDLPALHTLDLSRNRLVDADGLSALTGLEDLSLADNQLSDLTPLSSLTALTKLDVSKNALTTLDGIPDASGLATVYAGYNQLTDIAALAGLPALTRLSAHHNALVALGPTGALKHLTFGSFQANRLTSVAALTGIGRATLDLSDNLLSDLTPLASIDPGSELILERNRLADLSPLPDDIAYHAYGQVVAVPDATVGTPVDLGLRGVAGQPICPSFVPLAPCVDGTVQFPASGTYRGYFGGSAGPEAGTFQAQVTVHAGPDRSFTRTYAPTVQGGPEVGLAVQAGFRQWSPRPESYSYQWYRDGVALPPDPNGYAYHVAVAADLGHRLTVCITGHLDGFTPRTRCSSPSARVWKGHISFAAAPTVAGTAVTDSVLQAAVRRYRDDVVLHYQWQRNGRNITGATGATYTVKSGDVGDRIRVRVTGTAPGYCSHTEYSRSVTAHKALLVPVVPTVNGDARVGSTLTADPGAWAPAPVKLAYQWYRSGRAIAKATASSYQVTPAEEGKAVTVTVTASRPGYYTSRRTSVPTAAVVAA